MALRLEEENWEIKGLAANGPNPELPEKLGLFGQFVGDWEILECRYFEPDGSEEVTVGELHWRWILEGRAVQDTWMFQDKDTKKLTPAGTTVRFYVPEIDAWKSTWISPIHGAVVPFIGKKVEDDIVLEGKDPQSNELLKWIFSDIQHDSFAWREERSKDGDNWKLTEKMQIKRRK
jgi:hypothetical protein